MQRAPRQALSIFILAGACWLTITANVQANGELGRENGTVTVPVEIQWGEGSFVVVPFGDPLIPDHVDTANCPTGPDGFPNGGGIVISQGFGEGRHFGRISEFSTRCAVQFFPPTNPPAVNFDFRTTLTAANGDQIFASMAYALTPFTPPDVEPRILQITGGTGRFAGATGWLAPSQGVEVTCTDESGFCLEGTWSGGSAEGQLTIPRP